MRQIQVMFKVLYIYWDDHWCQVLQKFINQQYDHKRTQLQRDLPANPQSISISVDWASCSEVDLRIDLSGLFQWPLG